MIPGTTDELASENIPPSQSDTEDIVGESEALGFVELPDGDSLDLQRASKIAKNSATRLIVIAGDASSGDRGVAWVGWINETVVVEIRRVDGLLQRT